MHSIAYNHPTQTHSKYIKLPSQYKVKEDTHKKVFFYSGRTTRTLLRTKQKKLCFFKLPKPHETQEKLIKRLHIMFSAGQYIDQQKKDTNNFISI